MEAALRETLHRLMFTQAGDRAGNSEMEDTWVLQEEEEEEGGGGER